MGVRYEVVTLDVVVVVVVVTNKTEINGEGVNSMLRPKFLAWENSVGNYPSSSLPPSPPPPSLSLVLTSYNNGQPPTHVHEAGCTNGHAGGILPSCINFVV